MRTFISLPLDEAMRRHLAAIARAVVIDRDDHDVRWVAPQNLHVTLKFLGEVPDGELPEVIAALHRVKPEETLRLTGGAPDPARHRGRVHLITVDVMDADGGIALLRQSIEQALEPLGIAREKGAFWPHITIGRSRRGVRLRFEPFAARGVVGVIDRFELVSSTLRSEGSLYVPLARFPLGAP